MDKKSVSVGISIVIVVAMPTLIGIGYLMSTGKPFHSYGTHEAVIITSVILASGLMIKSAFTATKKLKSEEWLDSR
jgi:hypothetical protein